ncbi:MAG: hypothetical protein M4D80_42535 [Myxococcota bacterium]|nr:hypothetical protein [Myxococcota bacterium]
MKRWMLLVVLTAACGKGPSEGQCKQLLEHLVDLEFKKAGASATAEQQKNDMAKQKAAVVEAKQTEFMAVCVEKTAKNRVTCALATTDLDALTKCDSD